MEASGRSYWGAAPSWACQAGSPGHCFAAGQLPDVTIAPDGWLTPLTGLTAMVGLIGHPWEGLSLTPTPVSSR